MKRAGWSTDGDPRTRLACGGARALSDSQLLAAVLAAGGGGGAARAARELLEESGGIEALADVTYSELCGIKGIGPARACAFIAALELGRRAASGVTPGVKLSSSAEVYRAFWPWMVHERTEVFSCALVNAKLALIRTEVISRGTLTASIVHPREAFRPAVRNAASGVIFAHNHPSGDPLPSDEDRRITGRLEEVGRIIGIPLLDHVIIGTDGSYYSFADAGLLEPRMSGYRGMVLR